MLGSADFINEITEKHLSKKQEDRNLPALRELSRRPATTKIIEEIKAIIPDDEKLSNAATIYFCHRYSGASLKEIGNLFGIGESAVSQASRRFAIKMAKDEKLKKIVERIEEKIEMSRVYGLLPEQPFKKCLPIPQPIKCQVMPHPFVC